MGQVQLRDNVGNALPLMNFTISKSENPDDPYIEDFFTDYSGNSSWPHFGVPSTDVWMHVNYYNKQQQYEYQKLHITSKLEDVQLTLVRTPLLRASINGYYANIFLKGESGFLDLARLCNGEDIRPLLEQSLKLGSNGRRLFCMTYNTARAGGLPPFNPDEHPDYWDKFELMLSQYAEYGLYLYAAGFPDNGLFDSWRGQLQKQLDFWNRLGTIAQRYANVWALELTNEKDAKDYNRVADESKFSPIPGVICCKGSTGDHGGDPLPDPQWNMVDLHWPRSYPHSVKDGCQADNPDRLNKGRAVMGGEPLGFGNKALNGNREDNPRIAKEIAGSSRGTCCGLIFHSTHGGFSQLYDDTEMACAKAWFAELQGT